MPPKKEDTSGLQKLKADLKAGELGRCYVFCGEEAYLRDYYLGRMKQMLLPEGMEEFNLHELDGKGFSLVEVLSTCPTNWGMTPQKALEWVESDMLPYYPIGVYKDRSAAKEDAK